MSYADWDRLAEERFPACDPMKFKESWEKIKTCLIVGQSVPGTVIAKAPFGAWLDTGVGFPALLLIPDVEGLTPDSYHADDWCPIGSTISVVVVGHNDHALSVGVSQKRPALGM